MSRLPRIAAPYRLLPLLVALAAAPAWAHTIHLVVFAERGTVHTESSFPDGRPVKGGLIEVQTGGSKILEGRTDSRGRFSFPLGVKQDLTIVINAGMGHKNSFVLKKEKM